MTDEVPDLVTTEFRASWDIREGEIKLDIGGLAVTVTPADVQALCKWVEEHGLA
jgi:hypothetical protein